MQLPLKQSQVSSILTWFTSLILPNACLDYTPVKREVLGSNPSGHFGGRSSMEERLNNLSDICWQFILLGTPYG